MSDENNQAGDATQEGLALQSEGGTSTKTYTQEEVNKLVSDAAAKAGFKRIAELESAHRAELAEINRRLEEKEEAEELAKIDKNDTSALSTYQLKKAMKEIEKERNLYKEKADKADLYEKLEQLRKDAQEIASKYEGDISGQLINLTDGSREKMEELAKIIGKPKVTGNGEMPDTNQSIGGVDLNGLTPEEKIEIGLKRKQKK